MKNLMIYVSPTGSFNNPTPMATNDADSLIRIQIENSINFGWKPEDIILVTNFDFEYGPVKATALKDIKYFDTFPKASKINAIVKLFEKNLIKNDELYWFHDLDAFQVAPITESEIKLEKYDIGITSCNAYNWPETILENKMNKKWSAGSIFIKKGSYDIFSFIKQIMYTHQPNEEKALTELTNAYYSINKRIKEIDNTYNFVAAMAYHFGMTNGPSLPLKVVHFHPQGGYIKDVCGITLLPEEVEKIFYRHGAI